MLLKASSSFLCIIVFYACIQNNKPVSTNNSIEKYEIPVDTIKKAHPNSVYNSLYQNIEIDSANPAVMTFDTTHFGFDTIQQGDSVLAKFYFTNTGQSELMIREVYGQCSCSKPKYIRTSIKPGEQGWLKVFYNSSNKSGRDFTQVIIFANTLPELHVVSIGGYVLKPEN